MFAVFEPPKSTSILITQKDIRELQLAKSAIRAGIETLAFEAGIPLDSISKVYIAGGMGFYMNTSNAVRIGMLDYISGSMDEPHELAGAGSCTLCGDSCTYPKSPCRYPKRARRSMEACGMDVAALAKDCGINYINGENTVTYFSVLFW